MGGEHLLTVPASGLFHIKAPFVSPPLLHLNRKDVKNYVRNSTAAAAAHFKVVIYDDDGVVTLVRVGRRGDRVRR